MGTHKGHTGHYTGNRHGPAKKEGPAQNAMPFSAGYQTNDQIPQHLRYGQMTAAALSGSEQGTDPFAGTGQGSQYSTDSSTYQPNQGFMPTNEWGNYKPADPLANVSLSTSGLRGVIQPGGGNPNKAKFARHNKPIESWNLG
jgi:hypothetical protein